MTSTRAPLLRACSMMVSTEVSASNCSLSPARPRRRALRLTCRSDSSPVTYRVGVARLSASPACNSIVDLPMPGSPPSSVTEPSTRPPPSTRSSSSIPVGTRGSSRSATWDSRCGSALVAASAPRSGLLRAATATRRNESPAPHAGHSPCHCRLSLPHWSHTKTSRDFAMALRCAGQGRARQSCNSSVCRLADRCNDCRRAVTPPAICRCAIRLYSRRFRSRCPGGGKTGAIFLASRWAGSSLRHRRRPPALLHHVRAGRADALRPRDARHAGESGVRRSDRRRRRRQHLPPRRMALAARRPRQPDRPSRIRRRARRRIHRSRGHLAAHQRSGTPARRARAPRILRPRRLRAGTAAAPDARRSPAPAAIRTRTWRRRCRRTAMSCCRPRSDSLRRVVENPNCPPGCFPAATQTHCAPRGRATSSPCRPRCSRVPQRAVGHTQTIADGDGTVRADLAALRVGDEALLPSLATAVAARAFGVAPAELTFASGNALHLGDRVRLAQRRTDHSSALLPRAAAAVRAIPVLARARRRRSRRAAARQDRDRRLPRFAAGRAGHRDDARERRVAGRADHCQHRRRAWSPERSTRGRRTPSRWSGSSRSR